MRHCDHHRGDEIYNTIDNTVSPRVRVEKDRPSSAPLWRYYEESYEPVLLLIIRYYTLVAAKDVVGNIGGGLTRASVHIINIKHIIYTNVFFLFFVFSPLNYKKSKTPLKLYLPQILSNVFFLQVLCELND